MKRLICATLALSLLGATAASAQPYHRGGGHHRGHNGGNGAAIVGLLYRIYGPADDLETTEETIEA